MIRIQVPDRATADRIIAALYMAAGLIPPPARPEPDALALANEVSAAVDDLWPAALEAP